MDRTGTRRHHRATRRTLAGLAIATVALGAATACSPTKKDGDSSGDCSYAIGATYWSDPQSAGAPASETKAGNVILQKGITALNQSGGISGCQVKLYTAGFNGTIPAEQQTQAACARFTQDHDVDFAIAQTLEFPDYLDCMTEHGAVEINQTPSSDAEYARYKGLWVSPLGISFDRLGAVIDALHSAAWFGSGAKVGILLSDNGGNPRHPSHHLVNDIWKPALARYGASVASTYEIHLQDFQTLSQDISSGVQAALAADVQFKRDGVTHVIAAPDGGDGFVGLLQAEAAAADFHPQWETDSDAVGTLANTSSKLELTHTVAFGWLPQTDARVVPDNAATRRCQSIYTPGDFESMKPGNSPIGIDLYQWCNNLFFLQALKLPKGKVTGAAVQAGLARLGSSYVGSAGFGPTKFGSDRVDGITTGRLLRYDTATKAFAYTGPEINF